MLKLDLLAQQILQRIKPAFILDTRLLGTIPDDSYHILLCPLLK